MLSLYLLRHAKTNQVSPTGRDFDRSLLPKGIRQGNTMSDYMNQLALDVPTVWVSGAKRTRETFDLIQSNLLQSDVSYHNDLYLASKTTILQKIWKNEDNAPLLIIGHNFGISDVLSYLTGQFYELRTCGFVRIDFPFDSWEEISQDTGTIGLDFRPEV